MEKLLIPPDEANFAIAENENAWLYAALDGGQGRVRLDALDAARTVTLQWTGHNSRWKTVRDFLNSNLALNCESFLMDLPLDSSTYKEYTCNVIPDSISQPTMNGLAFGIQAQFEVIPRDDESSDWPTL